MQKALGIGADGDFGFGTLTSVKKWQRKNGLEADGIVGPATQAKMFG
jgi:peptidoglycan hydrolase-like protein with peptidoglycan-binding domain